MTLPDTVSGWTAYGFSIKQAVHDLIALHLARQNAQGHGNKARRRATQLQLQGALTVFYGQRDPKGGLWFNPDSDVAKEWDEASQSWQPTKPRAFKHGVML